MGHHPFFSNRADGESTIQAKTSRCPMSFQQVPNQFTKELARNPDNFI